MKARSNFATYSWLVRFFLCVIKYAVADQFWAPYSLVLRSVAWWFQFLTVADDPLNNEPTLTVPVPKLRLRWLAMDRQGKVKMRCPAAKRL